MFATVTTATLIPSEAQKVLNSEMRQTLITVAKDVKAQIEFNPAWVTEYRQIGYENRQLRAEDFNNDNVDGGYSRRQTYNVVI